MNRPDIYARPMLGSPVSKGFYVARKKRWRPDASFVVVMVMHDEYDVLRVFEPGDPKPSDVSEWLVRDRILGLKEASAHHAATGAA